MDKGEKRTRDLLSEDGAGKSDRECHKERNPKIHVDLDCDHQVKSDLVHDNETSSDPTFRSCLANSRETPYWLALRAQTASPDVYQAAD